MACIICTRPDVTTIDAALQRGHSLRGIARSSGASYKSIWRHATEQHRAPGVVPERCTLGQGSAANTLSRFHPEMVRLAAYVETVRDPATQRLLRSLLEVLTAMTEED